MKIQILLIKKEVSFKMEIGDNINNSNDGYDSEQNKDSNNHNKITVDLKVTESMSKIGITGFDVLRASIVLNVKDKFNCLIPFIKNKTTPSKLVKDIKEKLYKKLDRYIEDEKTFESAISDIEDQIVEYRNEILITSSDTKHDGNYELD